jgi:phosphonate transport system substrate-binding protein
MGWKKTKACRTAGTAPVSRRMLVSGAASFACAGTLRAPAVLARKVVTFGLTPVFLISDLQLIAQLEAYLSRRLEQPVRLVKRRTYQEITALLVAGQIDAAWICGFPYVQHRAALTIAAVPLYKGKPLYRSYLITRADRMASGIADLKGDIHAFSDPDSNSGFLVTRALLASSQVSPANFFSRTFFTYGHRNVIRAVAAGLAQSGSVDGYVWDVMRATEPGFVSPTRIVGMSDEMGFPPVACSSGTDRGVVHVVRSALVDLADTQDGRAILSTLRLDGFTLADESLFDGIDALWRKVREAQ